MHVGNTHLLKLHDVFIRLTSDSRVQKGGSKPQLPSPGVKS